MDIIDFRVRPKTAFFLKSFVPVPTPDMERYMKLYKASPDDPRLKITTLEESTKEMIAAGISRGVICGGTLEGNIEVVNAVQKFPDVYIGFAGINANERPTKNYKELEKAYLEYGLAGLDLSPYISGVLPNDKSMYPLYALSEAMGKTVHLHTSTHYVTRTPMDTGNPMYIDQIAADFPNMRIVMGHAGRGFGMAAAHVADRHPNVYLDYTALHPRYIDPEMLHAINSYLRRKAIYGSSFPALPFNIWEGWLPVIYEGNHKLFFHDNALKAMGMEA